MSIAEVFEDPIALAMIIIAAAMVVNVVLGWMLWSSNRHTVQAARASADAALQGAELAAKAFDLSHRPYLGVRRVELLRDESREQAEITIWLKNFGPVPASKVEPKYALEIDGKRLKLDDDAEEPEARVLPPTAEIATVCRLHDDQYRSVMSGASALGLSIGVRYEGPPGKARMITEKYDYFPSIGEFAPARGTIV